MADRLPLAAYQLMQNPVRLLFFSVIVVVLAIVTWFIRSRPPRWRYRQLRLDQTFIFAVLITATSSAVYGLVYDWTNISGSLDSYLLGLSSILFQTSGCVSVLLGMRLAIRALMRFMVKRAGNPR